MRSYTLFVGDADGLRSVKQVQGDRMVLDSTERARLKETRISVGLKQSELAEKVGVSTALISQIETGKSIPTFEVLTKIQEVLDFASKESHP